MARRTTLESRGEGRVVACYSGVARMEGFLQVRMHETVLDAAGVSVGIVIGFDERFSDVLFFHEEQNTHQPFYRSGELFSIPLSDASIGRVLDGIGFPRDGKPVLDGERVPVFRVAPQIIDRQPIADPLVTGIKVIDTTLPIGRGQRELIIGDRKLGKTTLAIDTIINQQYAKPAVVCVYVLIGQPASDLEDVLRTLRAHHAMSYTVIVAATAGDSFAAQYLAPMVGCTIAEHVRDHGGDALVVYDDLSKHAKAYRDISLLLKRAPGREAYPGDIFSLHATLLERAAKLSQEHGGGSLTALPIIETQEGNVTSYVPTNLISITDGQIYLENGLSQKGILPAVNIGLSVSRVGSDAQKPLVAEATHGIRLALSQYKELQKLTQLDTVVSGESAKRITRGDMMVELLKQQKHTFVSWESQVVLFSALQLGLLDALPRETWANQESILLDLVKYQFPDLQKQLHDGILNEKTYAMIRELMASFQETFAA